jgi:hypothetical protein
MNNTNMRYVALALALGAGVSNNIILYNEEIIITISFLGFLVTSVHLGQQTLAEAFDTRKALIQQELQAFFTTKEMLSHSVCKRLNLLFRQKCLPFKHNEKVLCKIHFTRKCKRN